ncbi:MAG: thiamine pyrophosphate-binding protein [Clostridia bacterium]|nr:thiamine pyrophosphate-binding protein [Clostridia bacterium]
MQYTGGEIIVKQLVKEGVPYIIGIPGHGVLGLFDAVRKEETAGNIKYLQVKHEQSAAAIADGYFRIKGKPLAVFSSIGPGTLNLSIGLGTAYADSTSFLALCGDTHVHMKGVGVLQELERYQDSNIIRSLEPLSKRSWRAESVRQLPRIMKRAFGAMTTGRHGPCVVTLPMDVQCAYCDCEIDKSEKESAVYAPCTDKTAVCRAVELMKTAKRPLILLGAGALNAKAGEKALELAEKWGAAVITTLAAKGAVSETHGQYCFHTGSKGTAVGLKVSREADVILALGTRFADETTCSYRKGVAFNFPDTKLIHVDLDPAEFGKNYEPDIAVNADVNNFLSALLETKPEFSINTEYLAEIGRLRKEWFEYLDCVRASKTEELTISQLISVLQATLPDDTIITTSSGNTQAQLFQEYCYKKPYCNLTTGGFSTMGWAVPAALGAKLACPEKPVIALVGDGDFLMTVQELSTIAQYEIPIVIIVADNSGWLAISDLQMDVLGEESVFGNDFTMRDGKSYSPDFAALARSFGIKAYAESTREGIAAALGEALKSNAPALLHVKVCRDYPNSGGKAFGWWDVPIPSYMTEKREKYEREVSQETV